MKRLLPMAVGLFAAALGAGGALADGSIKDGPAPVAAARTCDGGAFAGAYIGASIGWGRHDGEFSDELGGGSVGGDDDSVSGGVYSGYNVQCDRIVVGVESDYNYFGTDANYSDSDILCGGTCYSLTSSINWYSTFRGRLGLVHSGNILFYVTGGLAYADVDYNFAFIPGDFSDNFDHKKFGWTAGGGVEFIRHGQWSMRAEALYIDLGEKSVGYSDGGCGIDCTARVGWDDEFWVGRLGLTYRLGSREEIAPLK